LCEPVDDAGEQVRFDGPHVVVAEQVPTVCAVAWQAPNQDLEAPPLVPGDEVA
jgi:hypothetical protein